MRFIWIGVAAVAVVGMFVAVGLPTAASAALAPTPKPTFASSITAGFNSFNIPSGDTIWFSAVVQLTGTQPTSNLTIHFYNQRLAFSEPGGTTFTVKIPQSNVSFSTTATTAVTVWNSARGTWNTTVPVSYSGDVFLGGYSYYVGSAGIPGSTHVTWSGQFATPECAFQLNWKWGAAVYSQFAGTQSHPNYGAVGVKPVDDNQLSAYQNSDHAGTPENETAYLAQGAMGGGGSNYTGSYSGTAPMSKPHCF